MEQRRGVEVYVSNVGYICIKHLEFSEEEEEEVVALHPDQVPNVIKWLQEVLDERAEMVAEGELLASPDDEIERQRVEREQEASLSPHGGG